MRLNFQRILSKNLKQKGLLVNKMIKYMWQSDESNEFSFDSSALMIQSEKSVEESRIIVKNTPGLFIQQLDSDSEKEKVISWFIYLG